MLLVRVVHYGKKLLLSSIIISIIRVYCGMNSRIPTNPKIGPFTSSVCSIAVPGVLASPLSVYLS